MKVSVNRCCLVRPVDATFRGCMPLAEFDQTGTLAHVPTIYFYRPPQSWLDAPPSHTIFMTLQTSLSKALVHFYPLAGRLRWLHGARLELVCNDFGVELTEAQADAVLDDLGDFSPSPQFHHLIPQIDYSSPLEETPLMAVQVTRFKCGGIALSYCISHVVADGMSALHFISEWARLARGEPVGTRPFLDRRLLRAGEPPSAQPRFNHPEFGPRPLILGQSDNAGERERETTTAVLKLSESMVEMLKAEANRDRGCDDDTSKPYTRYEVISGHIWRCACKARRHAGEQPTALAICVDVRKRVRPPLPEKFFGNANVDVFAESLSGEVMGRPLSYAAGRIREKIESVTSEYVHSTIDFLKNLEDFSKLQDNIHAAEGAFSGNPNISVISWIGLPLHGVDFGWGEEIFMGPGTHDGDGDALVLPSYDHDGGGLIVAICLQTDVMDDFKKFFYQTDI